MSSQSTTADKGYHENVSKSVTEQVTKVSENASTINKTINNDQLSASTKVGTVAVNVAQAGLTIKKSVGNVVKAINDATEQKLMPILAAMGMKGTACLPISKQLDPVLGIDVHMVLIPPSPAPVPMPHPYIGMLFRPRDFLSAAVASCMPLPPDVPQAENPDSPTDEEQQDIVVAEAKTMAYNFVLAFLGATVKIGGFIPRAVASTPTKSIPHFPMGAGFHPGYSRMVSKNNGHSLFGSLLALADGDPISGGGAHLHNSCWDIGIVSPHTYRPSRNKDDGPKLGLQLFLPTGIIIPIPPKGQIITNPIPAPFNPVTLVNQIIKATLGKFVGKKLHNVVNNKIKSGKLQNMLHKGICTVTGHPVDVATGNFFTDEEDFFLPGPVPLSWERTYYSKSDYEGPLGNGWHHAYDMAVHLDYDTNTASIRLADGRPIAFEIPTKQKPSFNLAEQLELFIDDTHKIYLWDIKEDLYYYFTDSAFSELHLLQTVANQNGFAQQFVYNAEGFLTQITDSAHRVLTVKNDDKGRILSITAPDPFWNTKTFVIAQYQYDPEGNLIKQTNAGGDSMTFEYQDRLMITEVWRNGLTWHFRYDGTAPGARCIHTWGDNDLYNHKLIFETGKTTVTNSLGFDTVYMHKDGLVTLRVEANGAEYFWNYDSNNLLLAETDPLGNAYLFAYDKRGNQTQLTNPTGGTTTTEYNYWHKNKPNETTDALGGIWKWNYDKNGNTIQVTNPKGATTKIEYQDGLPSGITDPLGNKTQLEYDTNYNLIKIIEPTEATAHYEYDKLGRNTKTQNPKNATQQIVYDLLGRAIQVHDFDGNEIKLYYDGIDNLLEYQDQHTQVQYTYKGMWKMTGRYQNGKRTHFSYNTEEELVTIENNGVPYRMIRNSVGHIVKEIPFDQVERHYKYDLAGNVIEKIIENYDGIGKADAQTNYTYNSLGNVETITYHDGIIHQYAYNPAGLLTQAINPSCEVKLARDNMGNIVQETQNGNTITNTYNALGQRTQLQSSLGAHLSFEHNQLGQLAKMTATTQQNPWEATFGYDQMGLEIQRLLPGQVQQQTTRDALGRPTEQLTGHAGKRQRNRKYQWAASNRLAQVIDSQTGTTSFEYNKAGHLTQAHYPDGSTQNRYSDSSGNLYETPDRKDRTYTHGGKLEKKGNWHYKYNHQGFLVEKYKKTGGIFSFKEEHWHYNWNTAGMLESVARPDGQIVTFAYDALGRRLTKTYRQTTTHWHWDGNVPLHEWKGFVSKDALSENLITWVFEEDSFSPIAKLRGEKKYAILADQLGTPIEMYQEDGTLFWQRELNSNGKVIKGENNSCPFLYQGQYHDDEIELAYNRFRYYDPEDGRYISQDPIGLQSGELGFYNYVEDTNAWLDIFGLAKTYSKDPIKAGDVMSYREYKKRRKKGSTLRGHHIPQQKRLKEKGISSDDGTVIVMEHGDHTQTRTFGRKGGTVATDEVGKSLKFSENLDLKDKVVKDLGKDAVKNVKQLNRTNFPNNY